MGGPATIISVINELGRFKSSSAVSSIFVERYLRTAKLALDRVEVEKRGA
jgi:hypothetical protein